MPDIRADPFVKFPAIDNFGFAGSTDIAGAGRGA
jgi:hypothetical protein